MRGNFAGTFLRQLHFYPGIALTPQNQESFLSEFSDRPVGRLFKYSTLGVNVNRSLSPLHTKNGPAETEPLQTVEEQNPSGQSRAGPLFFFAAYRVS